MSVFFIAGHGDGDSGAAGNGYLEENLTREVVDKIPRYLSRYTDVTVGDTRRNWFEWLKDHTFDFTPYAYVLEIHFNAGANDAVGDGLVTGTEMYVPRRKDDFTVEERILENMQAMGFTNRGIKRKNYSVIYKVYDQGVSSALLETAFIDDADDMLLYQSKQEEVASAIAEGIAVGLGLKEEGALSVREYDELNQRLEVLEKNLYGAETRYNYIDENIPSWAQETVRKLVAKGWLRGNEKGEFALSEDMLRMLVINDRANLYES